MLQLFSLWYWYLYVQYELLPKKREVKLCTFQPLVQNDDKMSKALLILDCSDEEGLGLCELTRPVVRLDGRQRVITNGDE
jgi:hypothetical protein